MRKVVICQYRLLHYRLELFESLRAACTQADIDLQLVHGQATRRESRKNDTGQLDWATVVRNRYVEIGNRDVLWQPFPAQHRDAGLVVLMQENRLLSNYPWLWWRNGTQARVGYWGHGRNFQSVNPGGLRERWKQRLVGQVDWWFAYTEATRAILLEDGYPDERITVLNNAIDNQGFLRDLAAVSGAQLAAARASIDAAPGAPVGLFCGSLYPDKRLGFLIQSADRIQAAFPGFRFVVIGDGPGADEIRQAAGTRPWLHWLGAKRGPEKAVWFRLADVVLNPGLVGLHVLDAFCAGLPMVTTDDALHSPEIAYLENGRNGLIVAGEPAPYADAVRRLLERPDELAALGRQARSDADRYTLGNMVDHFVSGLLRCLAAPARK